MVEIGNRRWRKVGRYEIGDEVRGRQMSINKAAGVPRRLAMEEDHLSDVVVTLRSSIDASGVTDWSPGRGRKVVLHILIRTETPARNTLVSILRTMIDLILLLLLCGTRP